MATAWKSWQAAHGSGTAGRAACGTDGLTDILVRPLGPLLLHKVLSKLQQQEWRENRTQSAEAAALRSREAGVAAAGSNPGLAAVG